MNAFSEDISHFLLIYKFFIQTSFAIENLVSLNSDISSLLIQNIT
jgi:hypothetical protein